MPDQNPSLEVLYKLVLTNEASEAELQAFLALAALPGNEEILLQLMDESWMESELIAELRSRKMKTVRRGLFRRIGAVRAAAAAVLLLVVSGIFFLVNRAPETAPVVAEIQHDIKAPETNKATITLPNGKTIQLDTVQNGTLIAGIARKTADGQLVLEGNASGIAYIITSNPRNSKAMQVILPDHTEVWLNADTKLQYPTNYAEKDRLVSLNGEADFKVKHNAAKPFRVSAGNHVIEDVGTEFNVKAYANEGSTQTTLLEGAVKINDDVTLQPGQQFANSKVVSANLDEVMAWKNGSFYLDGRELGAVANELGRWYDVDVLFKNETAKRSTVFGGEMGRDLTLNQALRVLEKLNVHVKLEGKKLIVE